MRFSCRSGYRGRGFGGPISVPEIAAGYYWDPTQVTGSGASLRSPEGNGKTAYDMITPSSSAAPTLGTINGQVVMQFANGTPDQLVRTASKVQRGWTGDTYVAGWVQASAAPGTIAGHWRTANNLLFQLNPSDTRIIANDGGSNQEQKFPAAPFGSTPMFFEAMFRRSLPSTSRLGLFLDLAEVSPTVAAAMGASVTDTLEYLTLGGVTGDASTFNYAANFRTGMMYLAPGIPSWPNRVHLFNYRRLK